MRHTRKRQKNFLENSQTGWNKIVLGTTTHQAERITRMAKTKKELKYPKTIYIFWAEGRGDNDDYLTFSETPEEIKEFTERDVTNVAVYELKSLATLETKTMTTVTPQK